MKIRFSILIPLAVANLLMAQTYVFQDTLDGDIWTSDHSPYIIKGDITVNNLIIKAGVEVIFESDYRFDVIGILQVKGFYSDSVIFKPDPANTIGWQGINFTSTAVASYLNYCRIQGALNQGILINLSRPVISNCRIVQNNGTGIRLNNTTIELKYCVISNNVGNGIFLNLSQISIANSIISDNVLNGILSAHRDDVNTLLNTVIADNHNIGISCQRSTLTVINSIVFDNNTQIYAVDRVPSVSYSAVQGATVYPGTGNINSIPGFTDRTFYTLSPQSSCVDAGNPDTAYEDKYFPPSLKGKRNDMGAYGGPAAFGWYPPLYVKPQNISFGKVAQDSSAIMYANILNYRNSGLTVSEIVFQGDTAQVFAADKQNFSIPYTDSLELGLFFQPDRESVFQAKLVLRTSSQGDVHIPLSGEGIVAKMNVLSPELDFDRVALGNSASLFLPILNSGSDSLCLNMLVFSDSVFTLSESSLVIGPGFMDSIAVTFKPDSPAIYQDSLILLSNDPEKRRVALLLKGEGAGPSIYVNSNMIDFDRVPLETDSLKTLYVYNEGPAVLIIPYYGLSITGSQAASYSIENNTEDIAVDPADSAAIKINFRPLQTGIHQAELKIRSNDPVDSVLVIQLSGNGYDASRPLISYDPLYSSNPFIKGQSAILSFIITGSHTIDSAFVYIRNGGGLNYTRLSLNQQSSEKWSTPIDAALVTERGLEYYVQVHHDSVSTHYPENGLDDPETIRVTVPQIKFPWQTKKEIYQMISIPLETSGQDLKTLFQDELGPYDNTRYRIYELTDGIQYTEVVNMDKTLPPGKAVWLITKETKDLIVSDAQTITTVQNFELQLQQGWNLIAAPFAFPVAWNQVSTEIALRYYDGSDWPFVTVLEPFKGYAIYVPTDTVLSVPPQDAGALTKVPEKFQKPSADGWRIQILAESAGARDRFNYVGAFKQATAGIDSYDNPEPPPIGEFISLYLTPPSTSAKYSTDYRDLEMEYYIFEFGVSCNIEEQINISFLEENLPDRYDWIVLSAEQDIYYPQRVIKINGKHSRYKMIIGTEPYIAQAKSNLKPWALTYNLEQNYPNPFNPRTKIRFSVPEVCTVTINLYNILGQKINTLLAGVKMEAGFHQIEWDGTSADGEQVASGIYFLQLTTGKYNKFIKMILCR